MTIPETHPPEKAERPATFELQAIARELRAEAPYAREGQTARTLVRSADLRVVLVVLKAGKTISEHHVKVSASVQTLEGALRLDVAGDSVALPLGQLLLIPSGLRHDVTADVDSAFLLTLGGQAPR